MRYRSLCSTRTNGLYQTEDIRPGEAYDPEWYTVGQAIPIEQTAYDLLDKFNLQVCVNTTRSTVYIRRTSVSDNWASILTAAQIKTLIGDPDNGEIDWVEYNTYKPGHIYVSWNYNLTLGGIWVIRSTNYGATWTAHNVYNGIQNYNAACLRASQLAGGGIYGDGGVLYLTSVNAVGAQWYVYHSFDDGLTWVQGVDNGDGIFDYLVYVDPTDQRRVYSTFNTVAQQFRFIRNTAYGVGVWTDIGGGNNYGPQRSDVAWINPSNPQQIRIWHTNAGQFYSTDNDGGSWNVKVVSFAGRALTGISGDVMGIGRYNGVNALAPNHVFTTPDQFTTLYDKGGVQGSGTEIPFNAGGVASDGLVIEADERFSIALGGITNKMSRTIKLQENTVYLRRSETFDPFQWGGACMRIEDIAKPRGGRNPTYCQNPRDGGVEITGTLKALPGLPTSTLVMKEVVLDTMAEELENCLWDIDRRTYCRDLDSWDKWEKIRRICSASVDTRTDNGSTFDEDDSEAMTTMPVIGQDVITIRRVAVSMQYAPEAVAAQWVDASVCHGERCNARCDSEDECVIAMVSTLVAAGSPHLLVNNRAGHPSYWTDYELDEWTTDDAVAVKCLGDFLLISSQGTVDSELLRSYDGGATRVELTGSTDIATNHINDIDGITQAFLVAVGNNGYVYWSTDSGSSWTTGDAGVATGQDLYRVMIARENAQVIYAVGAGNALIKSENGGENWFALTGPSVGDNLISLWVENETHLLIGNDDGEIWESEDGGETWTQQDDPPGITPAAGTVIIQDIAGCGCGVLWMIVKDTSVACFTTDTEQKLYRNVDGGASGRWYIPEGGDLKTLRTQTPQAVVCCGPNKAIVVGGETTGTSSGFVAVAG